MPYTELSCNELFDLISSTPSAFICGNGLSINFDSGYSALNLSKSMFTTHAHIINNWMFDVLSNPDYKAALEGNFQAVLPFLSSIDNERKFINLFEGAVAFANTLLSHNSVIDWLNSNGFNRSLTFGLSPLDLVKCITDQAAGYGVLNVNYEYWTVLIYYCIVLAYSPDSMFSLDTANPFVHLVLLGQSIQLIDKKLDGVNVYVHVSGNGCYTYLRFLFATNILLEGKSFSVTTLSNWNTCNKSKLSFFLSKFQSIATTNYDQILETVTGYPVAHLHGAYSTQKLRVMSQSLGINYNSLRYDISTIIIGDYFLSKSFIQVTSKISSKQFQNSTIEIYSDILNRIIVENKSSTVVIFGLNIDNDFHIIRDIQLFLERSGIRNPCIIYCYYSDSDRDGFITTYDKCITYSKEVSSYIRDNIRICTCNSKELIKEII